MRAALSLLGVQLRASAMTAMQYRTDFLIEGLMSLYWLAWNLLPLIVLFSERTTVAGWDYPSALVLIGCFVLLRGILEGVITPSLVDTVERIRSGSFDYVLLRPVDAQWSVSISRFAPWRVIDLLGGLGVIGYGLALGHHDPDLVDVLLAGVLLLCGVATMYSLWICAAAASFWVVRLDNLTYLLAAVFDTARWPIQIFRGFLRFLFTFVIPLAVMTTYPAMAFLGQMTATTAVAAVTGSVVLLGLSRLLWRVAIRAYTSASS
jgi:ABC-2 type transport system permease protein